MIKEPCTTCNIHNCDCHQLALCFMHLFEEFPWLQSIDSLLLGLRKTFHFSSKSHFILHEIEKAYGMKSLNVIKAPATRWLSHGATCKHYRERYGMILGSLDKIITRNPRPELIDLSESLNVQITFLEDVLTVTNILSLVLQSDRKDFGTVRCALSTTLTTLNDRQNIRCFHLKSFHAYQDVLSQIEPFEEFHENIGKSFFVRLAGI